MCHWYTIWTCFIIRVCSGRVHHFEPSHPWSLNCLAAAVFQPRRHSFGEACESLATENPRILSLSVVVAVQQYWMFFVLDIFCRRQTTPTNSISWSVMNMPFHTVCLELGLVVHGYTMEGRTGANVRNHQFGICGHVLNSRLFTAETVCRNNHFSSVLETVYRTTTTHLFNIFQYMVRWQIFGKSESESEKLHVVPFTSFHCDFTHQLKKGML